MRLSRLRTDPTLERSGVWVPWVGGVRLKLRRSGNVDYQRALQRHLEPHRALIQANRLPPDLIEEAQVKAFAECVLVGWEGLDDDEDRPIAYTPERCAEILKDPGHHDFYEFAIAASTRMESYRVQRTQDDLGNSNGSSNGSAGSGDSRGSSEHSNGRAAGSKHSTRSRKPNRPSSGARSASSTIPAAT